MKRRVAWLAGGVIMVLSWSGSGQEPLRNAVVAPPAGYASVERLWTGAAPGAVGTENDDVPKLYCFPAAGDGLHAAVIVLPGGGYRNLVMGKEGQAEAEWLNARGVSAYVLQYRLSPRYGYPAPMLDGERAVRLVRSKAKDWNLRGDAIGVWGFSAGGHLAGYLSTADPHGSTVLAKGSEADAGFSRDAVDGLSARPDFAVISYGRLSLDSAIPGTFGMETLLGKNARRELVDAVSPILHVTAETSPTFLYATEMDEKVDSTNASLYFNALRRAGVAAELHIFQQGPHGTGMGQNVAKAPELAIWPTLLANWMELNGWMQKQ